MVVRNLTQSICTKAPPQERRYDIRDSQIKGLFLRIETSGTKTWYIHYRTPSPEKKQKNKKLCPGSLSLANARKISVQFLAKLYIDERDPSETPRKEIPAKEITLHRLIEFYEPWVLVHRKSGATTLRILHLFDDFLPLLLSEIDTPCITAWQLEKRKTLKGATINRRIAALRSLINWGAKQGFCAPPLFEVRRMPQNDSKIVTYATTEKNIPCARP